MSWTAPMTAVTNDIFTAAQYNVYVRDNLLETAPAKATAAGQYFVGTAANTLAARAAQKVYTSTSGTRAGTTFGTLTGGGTNPAITVTTGTKAFVAFKIKMANSIVNTLCSTTVAVSGATTVAAADTNPCVLLDGVTAANALAYGISYVQTLTAGSNTFTLQYRVSAGTGTFENRSLIVVPF